MAEEQASTVPSKDLASSSPPVPDAAGAAADSQQSQPVTSQTEPAPGEVASPASDSVASPSPGEPVEPPSKGESKGPAASVSSSSAGGVSPAAVVESTPGASAVPHTDVPKKIEDTDDFQIAVGYGRVSLHCLVATPPKPLEALQALTTALGYLPIPGWDYQELIRKASEEVGEGRREEEGETLVGSPRDAAELAGRLKPPPRGVPRILLQFRTQLLLRKAQVFLYALNDMDAVHDFADEVINMCPSAVRAYHTKAMAHMACGEFRSAYRIVCEGMVFDAHGMLNKLFMVLSQKILAGGTSETPAPSLRAYLLEQRQVMLSEAKAELSPAQDQDEDVEEAVAVRIPTSKEPDLDLDLDVDVDVDVPEVPPPEPYVGAGDSVLSAYSLITSTLPSVFVSVGAFQTNHLAYARYLNSTAMSEDTDCDTEGDATTAVTIEDLDAPEIITPTPKIKEPIPVIPIPTLTSVRLFDDMVADVTDLFGHFASKEVVVLFREYYCNDIAAFLKLLVAIHHLKSCQDRLKAEMESMMMEEAGIRKGKYKGRVTRRKKGKGSKRRRRRRRRRGRRTNADFVVADVENLPEEEEVHISPVDADADLTEDLDVDVDLDDELEDDDEDGDLLISLHQKSDILGLGLASALDPHKAASGADRKPKSQLQGALVMQLRNLLVNPPGSEDAQVSSGAAMLFGDEADDEATDHSSLLEGFYDLCRRIHEIAVEYLKRPVKYVLLLEEAFVVVKYFVDHVMMGYASRQRLLMRNVFQHVDAVVGGTEDGKSSPPSPPNKKSKKDAAKEEEDEWYVERRQHGRKKGGGGRKGGGRKQQKKKNKPKKKRPVTPEPSSPAPPSEDDLRKMEEERRQKMDALVMALFDEPAPLGPFEPAEIRAALLRRSSSSSHQVEEDPPSPVEVPQQPREGLEEVSRLILSLMRLSADPESSGLLITDSLFSSFAVSFLQKDLIKGCQIFANAFGWLRMNADGPSPMELPDATISLIEKVLSVIIRSKLKAPIRPEISRCLSNLLLLNPDYFVPRVVKLVPKIQKTLMKETVKKDRELLRLVACIAIVEKMTLYLIRREFPLYLHKCTLAPLDDQGVAECAGVALLIMRRNMTDIRRASEGQELDSRIDVGKRSMLRFVHGLAVSDRRYWKRGSYLTAVLNRNYMTNVDGRGVFRIFRGLDNQDTDSYHLLVIAISLFTDELREMNVFSAKRSRAQPLEKHFELPENMMPSDDVRYSLRSMAQVSNQFVIDLVTTAVSKLKRPMRPSESMTLRILNQCIFARKSKENYESCIRVIETHLPDFDSKKPPKLTFPDCRLMLSFPSFKEWFFFFGDLLETGCLPPALPRDIQKRMIHPFVKLPNRMPREVHDFVIEFSEHVLLQSKKCRWILKCLMTFGTLFFHYLKSDLSVALGWWLEELKRRKKMLDIPLVCAMVERSAYLHSYQMFRDSTSCYTDSRPLTSLMTSEYSKFGFVKMAKVSVELGRPFISVFSFPRPDFVTDFVDKLAMEIVELEKDMKVPPTRALFERLIEAFVNENRGVYVASDVMAILHPCTELMYDILRTQWGRVKIDYDYKSSRPIFDMHEFLGRMSSEMRQRSRRRAIAPPARKQMRRSRPAGDVCAVCRKPAVNKCSRCRLVTYCSRECQRVHWKTHKLKCKSGRRK